MQENCLRKALDQVVAIATAKGYVTFDDIMRCSDDNSLSIGDFDRLTEMAGSYKIIIYEDEPKSNVGDSDSDDFDDFAHADYEEMFQEVVKMSPGLEPLVNEIRGIKPPQRGEVNRLKYQVKEGNIHARERMTEMYLRQALRIAVFRAKKYDLELDETVGDAFVGLLYAVDNYDPDYSGLFGSFASIWILQNISREQSARNPHIYFPIHQKELFFIVYPFLKEYGCIECDQILQCRKVIQLIHKKVSCRSDQEFYILAASLPCLSLNILSKRVLESPILSYSDEEMSDNIDASLRSTYIHTALSGLTPRERGVLIERYGLNDGVTKTLDQVGQKYSLTKERIRQIETKALRKMRGKLINWNYP